MRARSLSLINLFWSVIIFALFPAVVQAFISTPPLSYVTTTNVVLPVDKPAAIPLVWHINTTNGTFIRSDRIKIIGVGPVTLSVIPYVLNTNASPGTTQVLSETVLIPVSVLKAAAKLGPVIGVSRQFYDNDLTENVISTLQPFLLTSSSVATFSIARQSMYFDDHSITRLVNVNQPLRATAEISYSGTGLLEGVWEVAETPSTAGQPYFRTIGYVNEYFTDARTRKLHSPQLPTSLLGLQLIRFRVIRPTTGFSSPILRYFVGTNKLSRSASHVPLQLISPVNHSLLERKMRFVWEPIKNAVAYKLDIFATGDSVSAGHLSLDNTGGKTKLNINLDKPPVTGMIVGKNDISVILTSIVKSRLLTGQLYYWRVMAIDQHGGIISVSEPREFVNP